MRPRLADHVRARLHRRGGDTVVVLSDGQARAEIGLREWRLLARCDGTRDLEGVRLAGEQRGTRTSLAELERFMGELAAAGMLEEGPVRPPEASPTAPRKALPLPGFTLVCDGHGTCCRFYDTVTFRPQEVLRARAIAGEVLDCADHPDDVFAPVCGSARVPWRAAAVTLVDGRCAFLEEDGRCSLHRRADAGAKPVGCSLFPMAFVDDGRTIRMTPRPECACVFASPRTETTEALVPVNPGAHVAVLDDLPDRSSYLAWFDGLALPPDGPVDGADWLRTHAEALDGRRSADEEEELRRRLAHQTRGSAIRRRTQRWVRAALGAAPARPLAGEGFYLRAVHHGHLWALDGIPLAAALRRRALVLEIARRLPSVYDGPHDPAQDQPIALVEALARTLDLLGTGA